MNNRELENKIKDREKVFISLKEKYETERHNIMCSFSTPTVSYYVINLKEHKKMCKIISEMAISDLKKYRSINNINANLQDLEYDIIDNVNLNLILVYKHSNSIYKQVLKDYDINIDEYKQLIKIESCVQVTDRLIEANNKLKKRIGYKQNKIIEQEK